MTLPTRFLITALFLCHQLLAAQLVTSRLHSEISDSTAAQKAQKGETAAPGTPCARQAATQDSDSATICADDQQEKTGNVYKLRGNAEVHYRTYILRADEITYDSDSGEATAAPYEVPIK